MLPSEIGHQLSMLAFVPLESNCLHQRKKCFVEKRKCKQLFNEHDQQNEFVRLLGENVFQTFVYNTYDWFEGKRVRPTALLVLFNTFTHNIRSINCDLFKLQGKTVFMFNESRYKTTITYSITCNNRSLPLTKVFKSMFDLNCGSIINLSNWNYHYYYYYYYFYYSMLHLLMYNWNDEWQ